MFSYFDMNLIIIICIVNNTICLCVCVKWTLSISWWWPVLIFFPPDVFQCPCLSVCLCVWDHCQSRTYGSPHPPLGFPMLLVQMPLYLDRIILHMYHNRPYWWLPIIVPSLWSLLVFVLIKLMIFFSPEFLHSSY